MRAGRVLSSFRLVASQRGGAAATGAKGLAEFNEPASRYRYMDFEIDGIGLQRRLDTAAHSHFDLVGVIHESSPAQSAEAIGRLLGSYPGDLPDGRVSLLVCPECGDLGCGAVTATIAFADDSVCWSDLGFQNDYDEQIQPIPETGAGLTFRFARNEYEAVLRAELDRLTTPAGPGPARSS